MSGLSVSCSFCLMFLTVLAMFVLRYKNIHLSYLSEDEILLYVPARNNNENECKGIAWHRIWSFHRALDCLCFSLGSVRLLIFLTRNYITASFSNCLLAFVYLVFHNDVLLSTSLFLSFHVCISGFWKVFGLAIKLAMVVVDVLACFPVQLLVYLEICRVINWCP